MKYKKTFVEATPQRYPVRQYLVRLFCDECGEEMNPTGVMLMSSPPQYPHECKNKHIINILDQKYPYVENEVL